MKHSIDPKIDCVFKALLGSEHNRRLSIHFLNAILAGELAAPLTEVIETVETEQDRWLKFFVEGERLDDERLPAWMQTEEMRQAMSTLKAFSEKERAYHAYQARQNYLRQQKSMENYLNTLHAEIERIQAEKEQARAEKEQARAAEAQERAEKEQARAEKEQAHAEKEQARAAEAQERTEKELERAEKEAALAEIERLKALLRN